MGMRKRSHSHTSCGTIFSSMCPLSARASLPIGVSSPRSHCSVPRSWAHNCLPCNARWLVALLCGVSLLKITETATHPLSSARRLHLVCSGHRTHTLSCGVGVPHPLHTLSRDSRALTGWLVGWQVKAMELLSASTGSTGSIYFYLLCCAIFPPGRVSL